MEIKILQYDEAMISAMTDAQLAAYKADPDNYSIISFKPKQSPSNGWAVPFVTKHEYKVHWRNGLDFTRMQIDMSSRWDTNDENVILQFNHTDVREMVNVTRNGELVQNDTINTVSQANWQAGDYVHYNDTSTRHVKVVVNGKNETTNTLRLIGIRCATNCLPDVEEGDIETAYRLWSDPESWDTGVLPVEGENVEIKSTWNMLFDIEESPILDMLTINGRLTFKDGMSTHLRAKHIFVRAGELVAGSEKAPHLSDATITLFGEKENQYMVYDNAVEAGNKLIANTGLVSLRGKARTHHMSRLTAPANIADTSIYVGTGLDWSSGDTIGLAPTSYINNETDYAIITSYESLTGKVTLDRAISFYHFGQSESTASLYNGVDIRGEVFLLSRNIKIQGQDIEAWGCQFVTSDNLELTTGIQRIGRTHLDNVEFYNCSQYDTYKSAIRFERHKLNVYGSNVTNCVLHQGLAWGIHVTNSHHINFQNNILFSFSTIGVVASTVYDFTFEHNYIVGIWIRYFSSMDKALDLKAGMMVCSFVENDVCYDLQVNDNVVAGADFTGFMAPGHTCGEYSNTTFKNNLAHSIPGIGAIIFPNKAVPSHFSSCYEGSYFTSYKVTENSVLQYFNTIHGVFSNMISIDNGWGPLINIGLEKDSLKAELKDSVIIGETISPDCPSENWCDEHNHGYRCIDKHGIMLPYITQKEKPIVPKKGSLLPMYKPKSDASWGGQTLLQNVEFKNFESTSTRCGARQYVIDLNPHASDYMPIYNFHKATFNNVAHAALAYLFDPPAKWAKVDDCGQFPCTAPENVIINFADTKYKGDLMSHYLFPDFQLISNNPGAADSFEDCDLESDWNAYYCKANEDLGILLFESLDGDKRDRTVSPIVITSDTGYTNTLNTFMDHVWDGFYTGQVRLSRFPAIVEANHKYEVSFTGTPPETMRFKLDAQTFPIIVRIDYPKAGTYVIKNEAGATIAANDWNDAT